MLARVVITRTVPPRTGIWNDLEDLRLGIVIGRSKLNFAKVLADMECKY